MASKQKNNASKRLSEKDGFTVDDLLHFGFDHIDTALSILKKAEPRCYDSAGYIANLGFELILKAWHQYKFGFFEREHGLEKITTALKIRLPKKNRETLKRLDTFYELRYPRRKKGPIPIGHDDIAPIESLSKKLWGKFPQELRHAYNSLDHTKKGGRILMMKRISS